MKKLLVVSAVAVLGLMPAAFAGGLPEEMPAAPVAASSSDTGIYVGAQGGFGMTNWKNAENQVEGVVPGTFGAPIGGGVFAGDVIGTNGSHKDTGFVGRVFAGYDINRYFAIEGGYSYFFNKANLDWSDYGPVPALGSTTTTWNLGSAKTMAFDLMGKGKLPVVDSFDLYAKLGVDYLMTRNAPTTGGNINNFNLAYGAGADYYITTNVIANLEWLRLNGNARYTSDNYQPNTDSFMIGLRYKFDL